MAILTKAFGRKRYKLHSNFLTRREAREDAAKLRGMGRLVRITVDAGPAIRNNKIISLTLYHVWHHSK